MARTRTTESPRFPLRVRGDPWLYAVARVLLVPLSLVYGRLRVTGAGHMPRHGAVIVVANHPSDIDPILVAIAVRRPLRFMADAVQFERGFVGWAIRRLGAFPVRVSSSDLGAVRTALALLEAGEAVAIFPEGDVYHRTRPVEFHRGVGLLAVRSGAPVVPVAIAGAEHIWRGGRPNRPWIEVRFGPPMLVGEACRGDRSSTCATGVVQMAVTDLRVGAA